MLADYHSSHENTNKSAAGHYSSPDDQRDEATWSRLGVVGLLYTRVASPEVQLPRVVHEGVRGEHARGNVGVDGDVCTVDECLLRSVAHRPAAI